MIKQKNIINSLIYLFLFFNLFQLQKLNIEKINTWCYVFCGSQNQNLMGNTSGKNIYIGGDGGQNGQQNAGGGGGGNGGCGSNSGGSGGNLGNAGQNAGGTAGSSGTAIDGWSYRYGQSGNNDGDIRGPKIN